MLELIRLITLVAILGLIAGVVIGVVVARIVMNQRLRSRKVIAHESASLSDVLQFAYSREILRKTHDLNTLQLVAERQPVLA